MSSESVLSPSDWASLLAVGKMRHFASGQPVFRQGDPSRRVAAIQSGIVKVSHLTLDGQVSILAIRGEGELIGEMGALEDRPRGADAAAITDCEICMVEGDAFISFLENHGEAAVRMIRMVLKRQREADDSVIARNTTSLESRLAQGLLNLADQHGSDTDGGREVALPLTQEDLASWVGGSRSEINRALRKFVDGGCLVTSRRKFTVLNADGLAAFVNSP